MHRDLGSPDSRGPRPLRIALLSEGTYPYHPGGVSVWCDQLVRGLAPHTFSLHSIVASPSLKPTWELPDNVTMLCPIPMTASGETLSSAPTPEVDEAFARLIASLADPTQGPIFLDALHELFELGATHNLPAALKTTGAVDALLEAARQFPDAQPSLADACAVLELLIHQLRPLFAPIPQADLCHATANGLSILPGMAALWTNATPLVISEHGIYLRERYLSYDANDYSRVVRSLMLAFFKHLTWSGYQVAAAVAPGSEYNCTWLEANGCDPEIIRPIYNGVSATDFIRATSEPEIPTLVWLGRIDPLKDVETLLHGFALVREELPEARLRIYGSASPENAAYLELCLTLAEHLKLGDSVTFEGRADSVLEAYHSGHIFVLTSISEGFPYTLIEAMASGKPTVATDVGGVREATGGAGYIVPPQDPSALADACLSLFEDDDMRRIIGRAARERILARFTLERSLAIFSDLYREVTGGISLSPVFEQHQAEISALPAPASDDSGPPLRPSLVYKQHRRAPVKAATPAALASTSGAAALAVRKDLSS